MEIISVDVRAILKRILETLGVRYELGTIGSMRSNNHRRHGNEPSGSINTRIFILSQKRLGNYQLLKKHMVANGSTEEMKRHFHYEARKDRKVKVSDFINELLVILPTSAALIFIHCNY